MHRQAVLPQTEGQTCRPGGQQDGGQGWGREGDHALVCGGKTVSKAQIHKPDGRPHRHSEGKRHLLHNCAGVTSAQTDARAVGKSTRHPLCCPGGLGPSAGSVLEERTRQEEAAGPSLTPRWEWGALHEWGLLPHSALKTSTHVPLAGVSQHSKLHP